MAPSMLIIWAALSAAIVRNGWLAHKRGGRVLTRTRLYAMLLAGVGVVGNVALLVYGLLSL